MLLIPGKMPKNCVIDCPCWNEYSIDECQLGAVDDNGIDPVKRRLRDCPLQEAPTMEMAINGMSKAILAKDESKEGGKELRARYGMNLSLEELDSIRKALQGKGDKCLMARLNKAIATIEWMKKRGGRSQGND